MLQATGIYIIIIGESSKALVAYLKEASQSTMHTCSQRANLSERGAPSQERLCKGAVQLVPAISVPLREFLIFAVCDSCSLGFMQSDFPLRTHRNQVMWV